jgi:hypothetical protein
VEDECNASNDRREHSATLGEPMIEKFLAQGSDTIMADFGE